MHNRRRFLSGPTAGAGLAPVPHDQTAGKRSDPLFWGCVQPCQPAAAQFGMAAARKDAVPIRPKFWYLESRFVPLKIYLGYNKDRIYQNNIGNGSTFDRKGTGSGRPSRDQARHPAPTGSARPVMPKGNRGATGRWAGKEIYRDKSGSKTDGRALHAPAYPCDPPSGVSAPCKRIPSCSGSPGRRRVLPAA